MKKPPDVVEKKICKSCHTSLLSKICKTCKKKFWFPSGMGYKKNCHVCIEKRMATHKNLKLWFVCNNCGRTFHVESTHAIKKRGRGKFCSAACNKEKRTGMGFTDSHSFEHIPATQAQVNKEVKRLAKEKANAFVSINDDGSYNRCAYCNKILIEDPIDGVFCDDRCKDNHRIKREQCEKGDGFNQGQEVTRLPFRDDEPNSVDK